VADLIRADPRLAEPVAPGVDPIGAELAWGVLHEGALCVEDLIDRRTRLGLVPPDGRAALTMAEAIFAEHATGA
jgi:glycerol-3-phosphate dehydrogenase